MPPFEPDDITDDEALQLLGHEEAGVPESYIDGRKLRPHVLAELLARFKGWRKRGKTTMQASELVGREMGIKPNTVYRAQLRLTPTTDLAAHILQAGAARLAMRVVRKADVDQAVDVLSRTNIGALAPVKGMGDSGNQFSIGVSMESLGAVVKVVGQSGPPIHNQPKSKHEESIEVGGFEEPSPRALSSPRVVGRSKVTQQAVERRQVKEALAAARKDRRDRNTTDAKLRAELKKMRHHG